MAYDKDWEVHLALQDPNDPIHDHIAKQLEEEDEKERDRKKREEDGGER
jgi:hypothetical protein